MRFKNVIMWIRKFLLNFLPSMYASLWYGTAFQSLLCLALPSLIRLHLSSFIGINISVVVGVINCWSVKLATIVQDWFTYAKLVVLISIILTSSWYLITGEFQAVKYCDLRVIRHLQKQDVVSGGSQYRESFENIFEGNFRNLYQASVGFYSGLYAYQGWTYLNFITDELINPKRFVPNSDVIWYGTFHICRPVLFSLRGLAQILGRSVGWGDMYLSTEQITMDLLIR